jgi:hypothetical protein
MRHVFLPAMFKHRLFMPRNRRLPAPASITAGTRSMGNAAAAARLIALACGALGMAPGLLRTASGAVNLTAVTATADEHLNVAAGAQKEPGRRLPDPFGGSPTDVDEIGDGWNTAPAFVPSTV